MQYYIKYITSVKKKNTKHTKYNKYAGASFIIYNQSHGCLLSGIIQMMDLKTARFVFRYSNKHSFITDKQIFDSHNKLIDFS